MKRSVWLARLAALLLCVGFASLLAATRGGLVTSRPASLATLGAGVMSAALIALALAIARLWRHGERRAPVVAEGVLFLGLGITAASGLANWALGVQGVVVLTEGEAVPLTRGAHLQDLSAGPLARLSEIEGVLRLAKVELRPAAGGGFDPESLLEVMGAGQPPGALKLTPRRGTPLGPLMLHQGAFGFAPRIVLQKDGVTVFDRTVPFMTRRRGPNGVGFEGDLELARDGVVVVAAVDLSDLDEDMKGHPVLIVEVRRGREVLGQGRLLPGHGATMREGWHFGYGGMKMWSEIDIRRRSVSPRLPALIGIALVLTGGVTWPLLARRRP